MIKITRYGNFVLIDDRINATFIDLRAVVSIYYNDDDKIIYFETEKENYESSPFRDKTEALLWLSKILKNGG